MSIRILRADGPAEDLDDTRETKYCYQVSAAGALVVLESAEEGRWLVKKEVSAGRWNEVSGRRFVGDASVLGGVEGGKAESGDKTEIPRVRV